VYNTGLQLPITCPTPHPGQARIIADATRHLVVRCGRRYGKTKLGIIAALETLATPGRYVGWFAPEYKYMREAWDEVTSRCTAATATANLTDHRMKLRNGSVFEGWHLDNNVEAGRSRKYHLVVIDEAGMIPALGRWWDGAGRPTLVDFRGRSLWLSTPNVIGPDFDAKFDLATAGDEEDWAAHTATTFDNPYLPAEELEKIKRLRKTMPDWLWKQEYMAIPAGNASGFFPIDLVRRLRDQDAREPDMVGSIGVRGEPGEYDLETVIKRRNLHRIEWLEPGQNKGPDDGAWQVWMELEGSRPDQSVPWCFGIDIGAGVGSSNSVISVGNPETRTKVAELAYPGLSPERLAKVACLAGYWWGGPNGAALIQFEINGGGGELFAREMLRLGYPLLCHESQQPGDIRPSNPSLYGWRNSPQAKETMLGSYRSALASGKFVNPSDTALSELLTFRYTKTGKLEAHTATVDPAADIARIPHGDRAIADGLLWDAFMRSPRVKAPTPKPPHGSIGSRVQASGVLKKGRGRRKLTF